MNEFVEENGKILKIDNPIGLFKNILSLGNDFKKVQREWEGKRTRYIKIFVVRDQRDGIL